MVPRQPRTLGSLTSQYFDEIQSRFMGINAVRPHPGNAGYEEQLATVLYGEGLLFNDLDFASQEIKVYAESLKIYESLLNGRPNVDFELALAINGYAGAIAEGDQDERVIGLYDKMIALVSGLDATEPAAHGTLIAIALFSKAGPRISWVVWTSANKPTLAALSQLRTLAVVKPELKILKCRALVDLSALYKIRKKWSEAAAQYANAVAIWRDLNMSGIYKSELATTLDRQGVMEADSGTMLRQFNS